MRRRGGGLPIGSTPVCRVAVDTPSGGHAVQRPNAFAVLVVFTENSVATQKQYTTSINTNKYNDQVHHCFLHKTANCLLRHRLVADKCRQIEPHQQTCLSDPNQSVRPKPVQPGPNLCVRSGSQQQTYPARPKPVCPAKTLSESFINCCFGG